jgi:hypothetical protein
MVTTSTFGLTSFSSSEDIFIAPHARHSPHGRCRMPSTRGSRRRPLPRCECQRGCSSSRTMPIEVVAISLEVDQNGFSYPIVAPTWSASYHLAEETSRRLRPRASGDDGPCSGSLKWSYGWSGRQPRASCASRWRWLPSSCRLSECGVSYRRWRNDARDPRGQGDCASSFKSWLRTPTPMTSRGN